MAGGQRTKLVSARPGSRSLRTTIPKFIVETFNLKEGDEIDWSIRPEGHDLMIIVTPIKKKRR
jgi:bifunctional DNA-binding transcriptional regulator/antitoxin component of YhaV-PrlF toxin-antitoxin module